ncbi:MAG: sugar phosphate nucleotidyltransferase, partial [Bdellovibrionota bacterium]|nr:sugar phosphate nucleotidyltransferase [Bdellovibrionota bacterium]
MKALILSAGLGTRFRPVTNLLPKPAIPFLGIPIALYAVEYCMQLGATEFYFNTHHLPERLKKELSPYLDAAKIKYHFIHEESILGSGGGLKNIESQLKTDECFLLCNADELILPHDIEEFKSFKSQFDPGRNIASLLCTTHPEVGQRFGGVWVDSQNSIQKFGKEYPKDAARGLHFMGVSIYSTKILDFLPSNEESNILYDGIMSA